MEVSFRTDFCPVVFVFISASPQRKEERGGRTLSEKRSPDKISLSTLLFIYSIYFEDHRVKSMTLKEVEYRFETAASV